MAAGLVGTCSLAAFYAALAVGTMGVVAPIAASGVIVPVLIGLAQGESPSCRAADRHRVRRGRASCSPPDRSCAASRRVRPRGERWLWVSRELAAVGFGLVLWLIGEAAVYSVPMTLLTQRLTSVVFALAVALVVRSWGGVTPRDLPPIAAVGIADAAANGLYAYSSTLGLLSVVSVLGSLYPVATVLLARFVLHERLATVQKVGVSLALTGVVMLGVG